MLDHFQIGEIRVPAYGLIVIAGICICNFIAQCVVKKEKLRIDIFLILEVGGGLGAYVGAKLLSILSATLRGVSISPSWGVFDKAGYSYYGGLAGFFFADFALQKIKKWDVSEYSRKLIFLIPLLHAIWKIGCFCGGCCFGVPYDGILSVVFPGGVNDLAGVPVFPVQLLEAAIALGIACILFILGSVERLRNPVPAYLLLYGATRFAVEFLRYHANGKLLSEGHAYSLVCVILAIVFIYNQKDTEVKQYE